MNQRSRLFRRPFWMNVDPDIVAAAHVAMNEAFSSAQGMNMNQRNQFAWTAFLAALSARNVPHDEQVAAGLVGFFAEQEQV